MINIKVKLFNNIKDRTFGLISYKSPEPIMLITRFGIHTLGLRYPIDVIILDKKNAAVKIVKNLKPNRFVVWPIKFNRVLELPEGFINKNQIKLGSKINLYIAK